jgi:hypothetical protein
MVKISTLFYIIDDTEEITGEAYDPEGILGSKGSFPDVSDYLDSVSFEVDPGVIRQLFNTLKLT